MKIISLNIWGGRAGHEALLDFFRKERDTTDVFCLQEVWSAPYTHLDGASAGGRVIDHREIMVYALQEIATVLPEHTVYFHPHYHDHYGLAMFVRTDHEVVADGDVFVYKYKEYKPEGDVGNHARNIEYVTIDRPSGLLTVINFHGLWNGKGKTDSEDRLLQSANILNFVKSLEHRFVLCGDFNLLPTTESLQMFEREGLRNLIAEYGVTSTRTSFYTKPEKFADYVFVSDGVKVSDFCVLPDEVSDHAPLLIEIE